MSIVLHATWSDGRLHLWSESQQRWAALAGAAADGSPAPHPFAAAPGDDGVPPIPEGCAADTCVVRLPAVDGIPAPSTRLAYAVGIDAAGLAQSVAPFVVPSIAVPPSRVGAVLAALTEAPANGTVVAGSVEFFAAAVRLVRFLEAQQRFVPMLRQGMTGEIAGAWAPWLSDEANAHRASQLVAAMPAAARAGVDHLNHDAWAVLDDFLGAVLDAECRRTLMREGFAESVSERDPATDAHVAWLRGLLAEQTAIPAPAQHRQELARRVRGWVGLLEERGASAAWRLCLRLSEPSEAAQGQADDDLAWSVTFHLQAVERPAILLDAEDIWLLPGDSATVQGQRVEGPQDLLLTELGRASRLYKRLESALEEAAPTALALTTRQAYEFLREIRPILLEQGFGVQAPDWWESPMARLGARLRLESDAADPFAPSNAAGTSATSAQVGLGALVKYRWEIAVGDTSLTLREFEQLAAKRTPLVRVNGRWVEIRPEDVQAAIRFIRDNPGGEMKIGEALRLAYGSELRQTGIPVLGLEATGWIKAFLSGEVAGQQLTTLEPPPSFHGTLRPYQVRGVSWMNFMERLGFGLCLADDMGLGKTVQLLALMAVERESPSPPGGGAGSGDSSAPPASLVGPTLLMVPMSVVGNWIHETRRFCPHLRVMVHHGADRITGPTLTDAAAKSDLVITTYALAHRDREALAAIKWWRIVLDEAQYIKNPAAKQTQAVRMFNAERRVALTGTPVENRLTELWSIMDFLNPGYLGSGGSFRQRFGVAVERYHDKGRAEQLRGLIRPFILRRLKTDPTVVADLPEKVESREFCHLTSEQASLYESCVRRMLTEVDEAEGIQRRGLVLAALVKLKQICNHPSQLLKDHGEGSLTPPEVARSGKCIRLMEMLDEILAEGDKSLIFTQFREMGHLLASMLRHHLGRDILFLHGGTTQSQRQQLIETFQKEGQATPILILSLKAGGVGLNLTAATHVFHFDRWWNPAVENQATDRAYRIGQTRTVQVHKFVVRGTLEERIDQMIESKTALAENIIGSGEQWLTELGTDQLREVLALRNDAVSDEA